MMPGLSGALAARIPVPVEHQQWSILFRKCITTAFVLREEVDLRKCDLLLRGNIESD
jgi:hypothetical protein